MTALKILNRYKGQGLSEMGISIALIAVVAIGGLSFLSETMQSAMKSQGSRLSSDELAQLTANPSDDSTSALTLDDNVIQSLKTPSAQATEEAKASNGSVPLNLANGQYLDLKSYPADLNQSIEMTGANGTTQLLLSTLDRLIQQAVDSGSITPQQANSLQALASQGHQIGSSISILENSQNAGLSQGDLNSIASQLDFATDTNVEGSQVATMRQLLNAATGSGSNIDPTLGSAITILTNQIINISNGASGAYYMQSQNQLLPGETFASKVIDGLTERDRALGVDTQLSINDSLSSSVHQNANTICTAGGGSQKSCHP